MNDDNRKMKASFFFVMSAAAAAAATLPVRDAVAQSCACLPESVTKTTFNNLVNVSTATYNAEVEVDSLYGFNSNSAPSIYLGWQPSSSQSTVWTRQLCRTSWTGSQIRCGTSEISTTTSTAHTEVIPAVTGSLGPLYSTSNSVWDRYKINLLSSVTANVPKANVIPSTLVACW